MQRPLALLLSLVFAAACGGAPTTPEGIRRAAAKESEGSPSFTDAKLQEKQARAAAEERRYRQSPGSFFPAPAPLQDCTVPNEEGEWLLWGTTRELAQNALPQGFAFRDVKVAAVEGDCSSGSLNGEGTVVASVVQVYSMPTLTTETRVEVALRGTFADGRVHGDYARYRRSSEPQYSGEAAQHAPAPDTGWSVELEYGARENGDFTEPTFTYLFQELGYLRATYVAVPIAPGVASVVSYLGRNESARYYTRNGVSHGEYVGLPRPLLGLDGYRHCYVDGQYRENATCAGSEASGGDSYAEADAKRRQALTEAKLRRVKDLYARSNDPELRKQIEERYFAESQEKDQAAANSETEAAPADAKAAPEVKDVWSGGRAPSKVTWPDLATAGATVGGGERDAAIIVGVEDYAFVSDVPGARQNAKDWYRYFTKVRGTSPGNVKLLLDNQATDVGMKTAVQEAAGLVGDGGNLWFVFIGHGAPSADQKDGLLVGVDAQQSAQGLYGRSVAQRELITVAAAGKQTRTIFVVDACFSGRSGTGEALAPGLQPLLPVTQAVSDKRALIFTAADSTQFAGPLPKLGRPAFSYLMLGGLLGWGDGNADGTVTTNELVGYSRETLRAVLNDRSQTPAMYPEVAEPLARSAGAPAPDVAEIVLSD